MLKKTKENDKFKSVEVDVVTKFIKDEAQSSIDDNDDDDDDIDFDDDGQGKIIEFMWNVCDK